MTYAIENQIMISGCTLVWAREPDCPAARPFAVININNCNCRVKATGLGRHGIISGEIEKYRFMQGLP
jgi:hypothetical protein